MTRIDWERWALKELHGRDVARFMRSGDLRAIFDRARKDPPAETEEQKDSRHQLFYRWTAELVRMGVIRRVQRDLYANDAAPSSPQAEEAAAFIRPTATISLQTVIGTSVLNNESPVIFATIPAGSVDSTRPRRVSVDMTVPGMAQKASWDFRFFSMPAELHAAGSEKDRLDQGYSYPRASVEKALCDYLLLGNMTKVKFAISPKQYYDLSTLDMDKMGRLVEAMGMQEIWSEILQMNPEDEPEPYSHNLGL